MALMMINIETVTWFVMNKDDFTIGGISGNTEDTVDIILFYAGKPTFLGVRQHCCCLG